MQTLLVQDHSLRFQNMYKVVDVSRPFTLSAQCTLQEWLSPVTC